MTRHCRTAHFYIDLQRILRYEHIPGFLISPWRMVLGPNYTHLQCLN